jgi:homopolymeric O-antigen transport system ATP-binding protein
MDADWMIHAAGLSKKFGLTLQTSMLYGMRDSLRRLAGLRVASNVLRPGEFWAVKDVSFELRRGESLGLMGVNGSGKTTLLRILNGVFAPDAGRVSLRGRVGALIAAGAGFAPMLTGRENVYVNGALLGMSRGEIGRHMDEILAFADLGQFIDSPVKHYSSGMFVRLGFAIAAMSEPEILLVDEVLAVGDLKFQKKCYDYLHTLKRKGTSIVLVSHSVGAIWALCDKALFMHRGEIRVAGSVEAVVRAYQDENATVSAAGGALEPSSRENTGKSAGQAADDEEIPADYSGGRGGTGDALIKSVFCFRLKSPGAPATVFDFREGFGIEARVKVRRRVSDPLFRFTIDAAHYRFIVTLDSFEQGVVMREIAPGTYRVRVMVAQQNFTPGAYSVSASVVSKGFAGHLCFWTNAAQFQITNPPDRFFYSEPNAVMYLDGQFAIDECGDAAGKATRGGTSAQQGERTRCPGP